MSDKFKPSKPIPVFRPSLGKDELDALAPVFESGWIGLGPKTKEFEDLFAKYVNNDFAIGVNSATSGLHLVMSLLNLQPGDEVIAPSLTFVSTNHAIVYEKGTPVFADVDPETLTIDPVSIEKLITHKTKAIICVHYGGHPADMDKINAIAEKHNIMVIEDAAHAAGSKYKGQPVGSIGDIAVFSFHAVKNLATGDGGMITTHDLHWKNLLMKRRWMGISKDTFNRSLVDKGYSWYYDVSEFGYKYHMNDITATIGIEQLRKLDAANDIRRKITKRYNEAFKDLGWMKTPVVKDWAESAHHNYVVRVNAKERENFMNYLLENNISAGVHYIPNHFYDIYKPYHKTPLPVTEEVWGQLVTLPLFPSLTEEEINYIIETIKAYKPEHTTL